MATRIMGCIGLGAVFLVVSPAIRQTVLDAIGGIDHEFEVCAPYSYVAGVVMVLLILIMSFHRGAQPR